MCADLLREVLGRALGGREPAKTLLLRSRFGGASARSRVGAHTATPTYTRMAERAATDYGARKTRVRFSGVAKTGGAEVLVFSLGKPDPDPELLLLVEVAKRPELPGYIRNVPNTRAWNVFPERSEHRSSVSNMYEYHSPETVVADT